MTLLQQALEALEHCYDITEWPGGESATRQFAAIKALREAIETGMVVVPGWRPISEAPKDFVTVFDGWNGERVADVSWAHPEYSPKGHCDWCVSEYENGHGWNNVGVCGLTHWMPTPPAPITQEDGK